MLSNPAFRTPGIDTPRLAFVQVLPILSAANGTEIVTHST
ncbi:hypothetical protein NITHO_1030009 [Nitrolancea hollandica Lb]|uniref:Uncharacterized protein n=1 Tax=Nitrolancea hollandica Lb TaxID=1129897 RepID=I4ECE3_9BACT|nr:hypothetical protein NITHO_1030009 [Nitrolancea hollandica Lb]